MTASDRLCFCVQQRLLLWILDFYRLVKALQHRFVGLAEVLALAGVPRRAVVSHLGHFVWVKCLVHHVLQVVPLGLQIDSIAHYWW